MSCIPLVLTAMLALPAYHGDAEDSAAERRALLVPVAEAICVVARTRWERRWAIAQSYAETRFGRHILGNPYSDGPWQVEQPWCPGATAVDPRVGYVAGLRCALRMARAGLRRCGTSEGAFAYQLGRGRCWEPGTARRVALMQRVMLP